MASTAMEVRPHHANALETRVVTWASSDRLRLYPPVIPILLFLTWVVSQALGPGLIDASGTIIGSDFVAFYGAGRQFWSGAADRLYDFAAQAAIQGSVVAPQPYARFHPFINPPFTAPFFALFATGGYPNGLLAWWVSAAAAFGAAFALLRREFPTLASLRPHRLAVMVVCFPPVLVTFLYGQNTAFSLLFMTAVFVLLRRGRDVSAGVALGLLGYKPQLAVALYVLLLLYRRWRALGSALVVTGLLVGASFLVSAAAFRDYLRLAPSLGGLIRLVPTPVPGLPPGELSYPSWGVNSGFGFSFLLLDSWSTAAADVLTVLLLAGCLWLLRRFWRALAWIPGSRPWDLAMAATIALGVVMSPHLFFYDLALLVLPIAIVCASYPGGSRGRALDAGPVLFWTLCVYVAAFAGSHVSKLQLVASRALGVREFAVQLGFPVVVAWSVAVAREAWAAASSSAAMRVERARKI